MLLAARVWRRANERRFSRRTRRGDGTRQCRRGGRTRQGRRSVGSACKRRFCAARYAISLSAPMKKPVTMKASAFRPIQNESGAPNTTTSPP